MHAEWPSVSTFSDLHADYDMLFGIGLRSPTRHRKLRGTTESFHDVDGTPRRQSRTTTCLGQIGTFSETYTTYDLGLDPAHHTHTWDTTYQPVRCAVAVPL